ncbi:hypothetical protein [Natronosalvus vescus]|nr:hypothetical protein [Natronosalvus vescus]
MIGSPGLAIPTGPVETHRVRAQSLCQRSAEATVERRLSGSSNE